MTGYGYHQASTIEEDATLYKRSPGQFCADCGNEWCKVRGGRPQNCEYWKQYWEERRNKVETKELKSELTIQDVTNQYGVPYHLVQGLAKDGRMPAEKKGIQWVFKPEDIERNKHLLKPAKHESTEQRREEISSTVELRAEHSEDAERYIVALEKDKAFLQELVLQLVANGRKQ